MPGVRILAGLTVLFFGGGWLGLPLFSPQTHSRADGAKHDAVLEPA